MSKNIKTILVSLMAFVYAFNAISQTKPDTTNISFGDKKILIIDPSPNSDTTTIDSKSEPKEYKSEICLVLGLDAGVNMLRTANGGMAMDSSAKWLELNHSRSLSWRMQVIAANFPLYKDYIKLKTGIGFAWNGYGLKNNVTMQTRDSSAVYATVLDSTINYDKNKFRGSYMTLPLLLELNSDKDEKEFHLTAGVIGGWNMGSLIRQKWQDGDHDMDYKHKGDYNVNPFTLDATARIGYKNFTLFAIYGLTPLFEKNKGPEVYPITVGLQIIPW